MLSKRRSVSLSQIPTQNNTASSTDLESILIKIETLNGLEKFEEMNKGLPMLARKVTEVETVATSVQLGRVLCIILPLLADNDGKCREASLFVLGEIVKHKSISYILQPYTKPILTSVLKAYSKNSRCLEIENELCIEEFAIALKPDIAVKALIPFVEAHSAQKSFPAIKILTKLISVQPERFVTSFLLSRIATALVRAYDHPDSHVQMSATFGLVALCDKVGIASLRRSYLSMLSLPKLKLLELYVKRESQRQG